MHSSPSSDTDLVDYRLLNTEATIKLARAAERAGVRRFVFLSSIRAQCGPTAEAVQTENLTPQPTDAYGRSKLEAEQLIEASGAGFTVLRPAVVYGPGVKGNIASLATLARTPMPLPFAGLDNRRSLLALPNLIAAISLVAIGSQAAMAVSNDLQADYGTVALPFSQGFSNTFTSLGGGNFVDQHGFTVSDSTAFLNCVVVCKDQHFTLRSMLYLRGGQYVFQKTMPGTTHHAHCRSHWKCHGAN
mgnify:CR=1 FL=1